MIKKIDRHITAHILGLTAIVGLGLVSIYSFVSFVSEIDETGQGHFGVVQLLAYSAMMIPTALYTLMPVIAMLGTLMGLGALAGQGEITAMRAAGVSVMRIGGATLFAGLFLGLLNLALGDFLAPLGIQQAESYRTEARYGVKAGVGGKAVWLRDGNYFFHIQRLIAEDHIADVEIFELGPGLSLLSSSYADDGVYADGRWKFTGVRQTHLTEHSANAVEIPAMEWGGKLSPEVLHLFVLKANALTVTGLWRLIRYFEDNGLDSREYRLNLWRMLVAPLTVLTMMLFAVPFVMGTLRDAGAGQRLLVGILIGVTFFITNEVCASLGQLYSWPPALAAGLPTITLAVLAAYRLSSSR